MMLAKWIGAPYEEITYTCAGINHMAWYIKYEWNGKDAYPLIRQAVTERPEVYNEEQVRNEMFLALDYYITESSGHNSEYNWWFRKRPDLIEKYCTHGTGWNPGEYAYILKEYTKRNDTWKDAARSGSPRTAHLAGRGHEYAASIINALQGGEPSSSTAMCPTPASSPTCPRARASRCPSGPARRVWKRCTSALPPQLALLTGLSSAIEEMAVEAR